LIASCFSKRTWLGSRFGRDRSRVVGAVDASTLTGGGWGLVIRRVLEAASRTLPLIVLLFIPIIIGSHSLYEWTDPEVLERIQW
jgi:hypothetical protein